MPSKPHSPFLLTPIAVPRVWGGRRLLDEIHPELISDAPRDADGELLPIGETWDVSDVGDDPALHSRIASGPRAGDTLRTLLREDPSGVLGSAGRGASPTGEPELPLLFKFIDAREDLSVQVHPSDALLAERGLEGRGKSEAWVILDAAPGSRLIVGFEEGWDFARYLRAARAGRGEEGLRAVPVTRGDVIELPAGLVHAIGGGILLAEIQQSSDITWRLHDWDRLGLDGAPRALHLDACEGITPPRPEPPCPLPPIPASAGLRRAIDGEHFRLELVGGRDFDPTGGEGVVLRRRPDRFGILALLEGAATVVGQPGEELALRAGSVLFVPASSPPSLRLQVEGPLWALWMEPGGGSGPVAADD